MTLRELIQATAQILLLIATAFPVVAQTTQQQTNWRVCDGKLYDASAWPQIKGTVTSKLTNGLVVRQLIEETYKTQELPAPSTGADSLNQIGGFSGGAGGAYTVRRKREVDGPLIVLTNFSRSANGRIEVRAMRTGFCKIDGELELLTVWDCGRPATQEEMRDPKVTGRASAMNATEWLAFEKKRAEEGNKFSQFRLGLRYLKGDGVETNKAEGERWIRAAAAQGLGEAKEKLKALEP
ncbi:MAG TPA: hypothetical protein VNU68_33495 [Verrucomicrobiae bacterium]|nr:hypothetical protein [Verrucomicrobiae bacterium]